MVCRTYNLRKVGHATIVHEAVAAEYEGMVIGGHDRRGTRRADVSEDSLRRGVATNEGKRRVREPVKPKMEHKHDAMVQD